MPVASSTHPNSTATPSTSRLTRLSHAAGKQPVQPVPKPLRRSPGKQGSTSATTGRHDRPSSSPRRRQVSLEAVGASAWCTEKRTATVKPASHVHRMLRSDLPSDATGVQVCPFVAVF